MCLSVGHDRVPCRAAEQIGMPISVFDSGGAKELACTEW